LAVAPSAPSAEDGTIIGKPETATALLRNSLRFIASIMSSGRGFVKHRVGRVLTTSGSVTLGELWQKNVLGERPQDERSHEPVAGAVDHDS
jgi:hypothetical protein